MFGNGIVDPMLENLIKQMLLDINTMLSLYDYDLEHYTVTAHKGSIPHTSMRSSDGHTRRDAFRWKGPNIKCTSVA